MSQSSSSSVVSFVSVLALVSLSLAAACGGNKTDESPAAAVAPATEPAHAASGVRPGSYEDWCGEHQVPESLCTRCNPKLIPAFKASGDWCPQHGLPESQCLACNPDLVIERPPKDDQAGP